MLFLSTRVRCFSTSRSIRKNLSNIKMNLDKIQPKNNQQNKYDEFLKNPEINLIIGNGPAGTGKTLLACNSAIKQFENKKFKRIVITRPVISVEEDIGFLPGNINQKMNPWTIPMFDVFREHFTSNELKYLVSENILEIVPLGLMRGRTFKDAFIIADEMQNSSPTQMLMMLTRIGENSKMAITGDLEQSDIKTINGFDDLIRKLNHKYDKNYHGMLKDKISMVNFKKKDVVRSEIVSTILDLYSN